MQKFRRHYDVIVTRLHGLSSMKKAAVIFSNPPPLALFHEWKHPYKKQKSTPVVRGTFIQKANI
ncbi:hypothetical protein CPY53_15015 [Paenibacillus polymyxa]|nr:hypothetical protein CPY53_15015 [Paenibacillus polymyxa]